MFNTRFNNGYQNQDYYNSYGQDNLLSNMMNNNIPYPVNPSQLAPEDNMPNQDMGDYTNYPNKDIPNYANGGKVKKKKKGEKEKYQMWAERIRQQGGDEDIVLAHINPLEEMILKQMGGSGEINPITGLRQYGLFSNPKKWFKSVIGPAGGALLGNMILPGIGGVIGGAFGGAAGSMVRGRNDMGQSALRGGMMGLALPTGAGLLGKGATALGAEGLGAGLSNYGTTNAVLPSIGLGGLFGGKTAAGAGAAGATKGFASTAATEAAKTAVAEAAEKGFLEKMLTEPANILALGSVAANFMNQQKEPKEKSPEQQADEAKRLKLASLLSPSELAAVEANDLAIMQGKRRNARKQFVPEERLGNISALSNRSNTLEERNQQGRWINYYNKGGLVAPNNILEIAIDSSEYSPEEGYYVSGDTGGQDDKIKAYLSDGEVVVPADVVAHLGGGNNAAGAKNIINSFKKVRKHRGSSVKNLPPKAKSFEKYLKQVG